MKAFKVFTLAVVITVAFRFVSAEAATTNFTCAYLQTFDALGTAGTTMPAGFLTMSIAGSSSTYVAGTPVTTAGIASAVASGTQTLTVWNASNAVVSSSTSLYNVNAWGNNNDRALGSDPTSVGAM